MAQYKLVGASLIWNVVMFKKGTRLQSHVETTNHFGSFDFLEFYCTVNSA